MKRTALSFTTVAPMACLLVLAGCEAKKSSNPLSPSVAGPIPGVEITAPSLLEPAQGFKYRDSEQPIKLVISNASSNGQRPITYTFEVASEASFETKIFAKSNVPPGDGRTSVIVDALSVGRTYFWRARGDDGANIGQYASSQFEVLPRPQLDAPALASPINNERATSRRPTFTITNSKKNDAVGDLNYDFQVATDQAFTKMAASGIVGEGGGQTQFVPGNDLASDLQHFWRVRSSDGPTTSAWSVTQTFRSAVGSSAPPPSGGGGSCASSSGPTIVQCIAAKYPDRLAAGVSLNQRVANMEFLRDRVIEAGICGGMDLARNRKRGNGPHSIDALAWRHNGIDDVVDIGAAYDDTSRKLQLVWGIVEGPPGYDGYPRPSCQ